MRKRDSLWRIASLLLCLAVIGVGAYVLSRVVVGYRVYPPDSDEAVHLVAKTRTPALHVLVIGQTSAEEINDAPATQR